VTTVFLIAGSPRERDRLENLLDQAGAEVVGSAADMSHVASDVMELAEVVLLDASGEAPEELLESLQGEGLLSETRVFLLAGARPATWASRALRLGVRAVLPSDSSAREFRAALDAVAQDLLVLHRSDLQAVDARDAAEASDFVEPLTSREREVLQMLAQGYGNKEIASRLHISDHTAKFHVASILGKLGASSRTEAVSLALRRGLVLL
jgi:two-component system, NarL family, response regulator YdfI